MTRRIILIHDDRTEAVVKKSLSIIVAFVLSVPIGVALADAEQTAKTLCAGCHGPEGISTNPLWPNLAGQKAPYFEKQMRAYRDGSRPDPNMNALSQGLTDEEIRALADYYARLECRE